MKSPHIPHRFLLASALNAATILFANAATYYWNPGTAGGVWTSLSNWSTEAIGGATATALPGSGDSLWGNGDYNFDLDGGSYSLAGWPTPSDWNNHYLTVANGTLTFTGEVSTHSGQIIVDADGILNLASSFTPGMYSGAGMTISVNNGGTMSVSGNVRLYNGSFAVASGGNLTFAPSSLRFGAEAHDYALTFSNSGTLSLPNGFSFNRWDTATVDAGSTYAFSSSGTLNLGGPIANAPSSSSSKPGPFTVVLSGGTINVTGNVTFDVSSVSLENAVTFNVDSGKTINLAPVVFASGSSITKTGAGTIILPTTAPTTTLSAGSLALNAATYDLSSVTFGAGSTISLAAMGARVDTLPATLANATFVADLSSVPAGTVVFQSAAPSVLAKVKSDLDASTPSGMSLVVSGETLSLEELSDYIFNSTSVTDLLNGSGWNTGSVPPANVSIAIDGAGVVAEFSSGTIPAWSSIEVKNGAVLRMNADADLPAVVLNKNATLDIASGTTHLTSGISCTAFAAGDNVTLPILSIQTNATLSVASGMKFKNVDFRLFGTVAKASISDDPPVFGSADVGETSYFAFTSDGGVFDIHSNQSAPKGSVYFFCPSAGGTVTPVGTITLRNSSRTVTGWDDFGNWEFGSNNPMTVPFDVLIDGTHIDMSAYFYVRGAAHLSLVNGARIQRAASCAGHYFSQAIGDAATIVIGEGCFYDFTTGDGVLGIDSQSAVDTITVRDGGIYNATYNSSGWGQGVFVGDDGILGVSKLYGSRAPRSDLLCGFGSARIDGGLTIASINGIGHGSTDWDRHTQMANIPFAGTGDVVVSNGVPDYPFSVTIRNGASTATGSICVAAIEDADTALYFVNGANWAGTVKASGDVRLVSSFAEVTNSAAVPAPVAVSFGGVQLLDNAFKLRLWQNGTCDTINIGANGWSGTGKLDFEFVDFASPGAQAWKVATQPAGTALPSVKKASFSLYTQTSATEGLVDVFLKVANGTAILLR